MAASVNASTVGGVANKDNTTKISQKPSTNHRQRFTRTLQHYVSNNNASSAPTAVIVGGSTLQVRQGWHLIPYMFLFASMTAADQESVLRNCKRYKIVSQGFKIVKNNCIQQQVNNNASTTTISSSFVQAPSLLVFDDGDNDLYECVFRENASLSTTSNAWSTLTEGRCNSLAINATTGFEKIFAGFVEPNNAGTSGVLPGCLFWLPLPPNITTAPPPDCFDLFNGGNITNLQSGQEFEYTWSGGTDWLAPNADFYNSGFPTPEYGGPIAMQMLQSTMAIRGTVMPNTTENDLGHPTLHLVRVPPLQDTLGNIIVAFELWVEYFCEIEWEEGRYQYSTANVAGVNQMLIEELFPFRPPVDLRHIKKPLAAVGGV